MQNIMVSLKSYISLIRMDQTHLNLKSGQYKAAAKCLDSSEVSIT